MPSSVPLDDAESLLWRSFIRCAMTLPRLLDQDLLEETGLSLTEYAVMMHLSEAAQRQLRMAGLANHCSLSPSRMTRVVSGLEQRGYVMRSVDPDDRRATMATLTAEGLRALRRAYPKHLASVRRRFLDHVETAEVTTLGPVLERLADLADPQRCPGAGVGQPS